MKGEYWIVNRVSFVTDEHIAAAVTAGPERFGSLAARVATLPADEVAYVYYTGRERPDELPAGVAFDKVNVAEATLFIPTDLAPKAPAN